MRLPLITPFQSIFTASFVCCCVPRYWMGGLPAGVKLPLTVRSPLGTAIPATAGFLPQASTPLMVPDEPFLSSPLVDVQPESTFTWFTFQYTSCATVRSPRAAML